MRSLGGAWAFPPIVTINGQILHNLGASNVLARGRLLVVDAGRNLRSITPATSPGRSPSAAGSTAASRTSTRSSSPGR